MSNVSIAWSESVPADGDLISQGAGVIRSTKTSVRAAFAAEHAFPSSGGSAGSHNRGSARAFVGPASAISSADTDGRMMWDSTNSRLMYVGSEGTNFIGGARTLSFSTAYPLAAGQQIVSLMTTVVTPGLGATGGSVVYGVTFASLPSIFASVQTTGDLNGLPVVHAQIGEVQLNTCTLYLYAADGVTPSSGQTRQVNIMAIGPVGF